MSTAPQIQSQSSFSVTSLGPEAVALRARPTGGRVIAVVSNAAYLETHDGLILCIVGGDIDSPLTLRIDNLVSLLNILRNHPDATFRATENVIQIGSVARLEWAHSSCWIPRLHRELGLPEARQSAISALSDGILDADRMDGCGPLVQHFVGARSIATHAMLLPADASPLDPSPSRLLQGIIVVLDAAQVGDYTGAATALSSLVGLGHGLTPSGDDLTMGVVAMLVWQAELGYAPADFAREIVVSLSEFAPTRTNRISARLLWHASKGVLYAPAMELGAALLAGDVNATRTSSHQLFSIGSTTGVDLAVGILLGMLLGVGND